MKVFFILFFIVISRFCFGEIDPFIPDEDNRVERAEFVSSFIKPGDVGAEIGVFFGGFAYHTLLKNQPSKLYLIDPWEFGLQVSEEPNPTPECQRQRDLQAQYVYKCFAPFENVEIIRLRSEDAAGLFQDDYFDYVYIDGLHSYDGVMSDLTNYLPKIKVGGYLIGDDYGWTGIGAAVQDFLKTHQGEVLFGNDPYAEKTGGQFTIQRLK